MANPDGIVYVGLLILVCIGVYCGVLIFEEEDLMIMRAIDQRLGTKSDWVREIIKKFL